MVEKISLLLSFEGKVFEVPISKKANNIIEKNNKTNKLKLKFEGISYETKKEGD